MENHKAEIAAPVDTKGKLRQEIVQLRADLFNLQKFASCSLTHLEQILQALEETEKPA